MCPSFFSTAACSYQSCRYRLSWMNNSKSKLLGITLSTVPMKNKEGRKEGSEEGSDEGGTTEPRLILVQWEARRSFIHLFIDAGLKRGRGRGGVASITQEKAVCCLCCCCCCYHVVLLVNLSDTDLLVFLPLHTVIQFILFVDYIYLLWETGRRLSFDPSLCAIDWIDHYRNVSATLQLAREQKLKYSPIPRPSPNTVFFSSNNVAASDLIRPGLWSCRLHSLDLTFAFLAPFARWSLHELAWV